MARPASKKSTSASGGDVTKPSSKTRVLRRPCKSPKPPTSQTKTPPKDVPKNEFDGMETGDGEEQGEEEPVREVDPLVDEKSQVLKKPSHANKGKAELVCTEKHGNWTFQRFKRSTTGLPFNKFVGPDGKIYWTNHAAEAAGFKRLAA